MIIFTVYYPLWSSLQGLEETGMNYVRCYLHLPLIIVIVSVHGITQAKWKLIETGRDMIFIGKNPKVNLKFIVYFSWGKIFH